MRRIVAWLLLLCASEVFAQQPQLKIVVVEGEGAVNIIQQKTAVRAVVEVRDQNNLPVPGATVTFAVTSKGGATVAGAQTITVSTNAAGQAALTGVTPISSGGLQISVNATFNGLTASTSITQSVVTTVAAASAGAGAAGAGAAGAGAAGAGAGAAGAAVGGGLSTAAVAGIVGGVAAIGGGVAATGGSDNSSDGSRSTGGVDPTGSSGPGPTGGLPSCEWLTLPRDIVVGNEGASIALTITVTNTGPCYDTSWGSDLGNAGSWISINPRAGPGNGNAVLTIAPYVPTPGAPNRVATIIVAYERVLISQPCRCPITGLPLSSAFDQRRRQQRD